MKIRGRFLDKNGRVAKGSWATICEEATLELGFTLTVTQAMKRVKDILRKTSMQDADDKDKELYRGWNLEDTRQLVEYVRRAEGKEEDHDEDVYNEDGYSTAGVQPRRPRGFWMEIAQRLNRCPAMCRERYYWLEKANAPMFS